MEWIETIIREVIINDYRCEFRFALVNNFNALFSKKKKKKKKKKKQRQKSQISLYALIIIFVLYS